MYFYHCRSRRRESRHLAIVLASFAESLRRVQQWVAQMLAAGEFGASGGGSSALPPLPYLGPKTVGLAAFSSDHV